MFPCLVIALLVLLPHADGVSNAGKKFFQTFNFNHPTVEAHVLHAFILSTDAANCTVKITVAGPPLTTKTVPVSKSQAVVYQLKVASTRGVKLEAPCDFVVYGLNFAPESADGWLALPVESLGSEYVILGVQPWLADPTQLTIVATSDNTTCKSIFPNGTQHVSILNALGVDYMTSDLDLTGTRVECDNRVTVLTGQRCSTVPQGCTACDHTVEQVPPKSTLGRNFAMVPLRHTCKAAPKCCSDPLFCAKCTEIYRILAVENDTQVVRNGTETNEAFTLQAGESRYILLSQTEYSSLVSTKPVILGHYFNGQEYEGQNEDPAFAIIPQIESYARRYQAATCFPQFETHFVNLVVQTNTSPQLLLNGAPFLAANTARQIPGTNFEAFQYQFDCSKANGRPISFTIEHTQNASFGLFAYGFSAWISYGYPGGMTLNEDLYYKCVPPQINVTSDPIAARACNLTDFVPRFATPTTWTDEQCCQGGNTTVTSEDTVITATPCLKTIQRTWTLKDGCGRSVQAIQMAVIEKLVDIYQAPPAHASFNGECASLNASNATGEPMLERSCGTTISVRFTDVSDNATHVNRTWVISKECVPEEVFNQTITCEPVIKTTITSTEVPITDTSQVPTSTKQTTPAPDNHVITTAKITTSAVYNETPSTASVLATDLTSTETDGPIPSTTALITAPFPTVSLQTVSLSPGLEPTRPPRRPCHCPCRKRPKPTPREPQNLRCGHKDDSEDSRGGHSENGEEQSGHGREQDDSTGRGDDESGSGSSDRGHSDDHRDPSSD